MVPWASTNLHHQTAFWFVQPFLQGSRAADSCDQWSDAQRCWQATLCQDICRNRPHLDSAAKWHVHKWYCFIRCHLLVTVTLVCYQKMWQIFFIINVSVNSVFRWHSMLLIQLSQCKLGLSLVHMATVHLFHIDADNQNCFKNLLLASVKQELSTLHFVVVHIRLISF